MQIFNQKYENFSSRIPEVTQFYKGENFFEIETDGKSVEQVCAEADKAFKPEVVLIRGEIKEDFISYLERRGYKSINAANLLKLWRLGRGLSETSSIHKLADDPELLNILRRILFSGTGRQKFVIYNFLFEDLSLLDEFETSLCEISQVYFLYKSSLPMPDEVSLRLYNQKKLSMLDCEFSDYDQLFKE